LNKNIDLTEKEKILEAQLWRDKQFENLQLSKKQLLIYNFILNQIHKLSKLLMKSSKISADKKNKIIKMKS
jgi:hypothetical protein